MGTNYVKKARTVRLPVVTDTQVNQFGTGVKSEIGSYIYNGIILQYPDGKYYVTQRPSVNISHDPDDESVSDNQGRCVYYWDQVGTGLYVIADYADDPTADYAEGSALPGLYIVNAAEIYKDDYSTVTSGASITTGTQKIYAAELGDNLVFLDVENNQMWYIASASPTVLVTMNDGTATTFDALPQNQTPTKYLAHGIAVLDQYMFVLATDGTIWNSDVVDSGGITDWDDLTYFTTAEKEEDQGVWIGKHHDNVVVFGKRTTEFFYNAGNSTGSPLSVRDDISYNIGCADGNSVWQSGDDIYFLGRDGSGQIQPYILSKFEITPLSNSSVSSYFGQSGYTYLGSGFTAGGIAYYILSTTTVSGGEVSPLETNVYNSNTQTWTEWDYSGSLTNNFPMISFTISGGSSAGYGQLTTGETFQVADNYTPTDDSDNITMKIRMDNFDADSRDWKYGHQLRYVGDSVSSSANVTVKWSDDNNKSYSSGRTIDISDSKNKLTRLGRFKSRSHELEYSGSEQIRVEGLDIDITEGTH